MDAREVEDSLVFVELRPQGRPLDPWVFEDRLPGWLDTVLCVVVPVIVALGVVGVFALARLAEGSLAEGSGRSYLGFL